MKEFKIHDKQGEFKLNLPTSLKEITPEYLKKVTADIEIAPYYAIVAMAYRCKLPEIISSNKKSKSIAISIIPLIVRCNIGDNTETATTELFKRMKEGDRLIIAGTDLERGYQLATPKNFITIDNIVRIYNYDMEFAKGVMIDQNYYYFVDFKLVPITDIKGFYKDNNDNVPFVNPFIIRTEIQN